MRLIWIYVICGWVLLNAQGEIKQPDWVREYGSELAPSDEIAVDMVLDSQGNTIVTGYRQAYRGGTEWYTMKYDPDGVELWGKALVSDILARHKPAAITLDDADNIYVTGMSFITALDAEFTTVKYDQAGNFIWRAGHNPVVTTRYNRRDRDIAQKIICDSVGNIYVAGKSAAYKHDSDYILIKYNSFGEEQWIADHYAPPRYLSDRLSINDIAIDYEGSIIITGGEYHESFSTNRGRWVTIKYDSTGAQQWITKFGSDINKLENCAQAMTVDDSGNVYVTGGGKCSSIVTAKYFPTGEVDWVTEQVMLNYDDCGVGISAEGRAIEINADGDIIVVGYGGWGDYIKVMVVLKYAQDGALGWMHDYPERSTPIGIRFGQNGSIVIVGWTRVNNDFVFSIIKTSSTGQTLWTTNFPQLNGYPESYRTNIPVGMEIDEFGNIIVAGYVHYNSNSYGDYATIKLSPNGDNLWERKYSGQPISQDQPLAIRNDSDGNVYALVQISVEGDTSDYRLFKYRSDGEIEWVQSSNGLGRHNIAKSLEIDVNGNIHVLAVIRPPWQYGYVATISYGPDGSLIGVTEFEDGSGSTALVMAVDGQGNTYVAGNGYPSDREHEYNADLFIVKYNVLGNEQWVRWFDGPGPSFENPGNIEVDRENNLYILTGSVTYSNSSTLDSISVLLIKMDSQGEQKWVSGFSVHRDGYNNNYLKDPQMIIDSEGNPVVLMRVSDGEKYFSLTTYNQDGGILWRYEEPGFYEASIVSDMLDGVYLASENNQIKKFNSEGVELWHKNVSYYGRMIVVDKMGNILGARTISESLHRGPLLAFGLDQNANGQWYSYLEKKYRTVKDLSVATDGSLYLLASISNGEVAILKYPHTVQSVTFPPTVYSLKQNYPNPFKATTSIRFVLDKVEYANLRIFNILGQQVDLLVSKQLSVGPYEYIWHPEDEPSGIYFYQLQVGRKIESKKMVYLK